MFQSRSVFTAFTVFVFSLILSNSISAQTDVKPQFDPNYAVTLQVVIGSNDNSSKGEVPKELANISRGLRSQFPFTNYRLASTFLGRITNGGTFEYKSVSNTLGQAADAEAQTFLEWTLGGFHNGANGFQAQTFRFGARVPVRTGVFKDEGKTNAVISYEPIGLNISHVGISENVPTLLGTLTLPKTDGTMFLVITVSAADR